MTRIPAKTETQTLLCWRSNSIRNSEKIVEIWKIPSLAEKQYIPIIEIQIANAPAAVVARCVSPVIRSTTSYEPIPLVMNLYTVKKARIPPGNKKHV